MSTRVSKKGSLHNIHPPHVLFQSFGANKCVWYGNCGESPVNPPAKVPCSYQGDPKVRLFTTLCKIAWNLLFINFKKFCPTINVYLSYVYPSICRYFASFSCIYLCVRWSIYLSVIRSKAILLIDKRNEVTFSCAEL